VAKKKKQNSTGKKPALQQPVNQAFYQNIKAVLEQARQSAYRAVNFAMVMAYWEIGRLIVDEEQQGKDRAVYGKALVEELSRRLTADYGKGFRPSNLWYMVQFYRAFPILHSSRGELTDMKNQDVARLKSGEIEKVNAPRAEFPPVEKSNDARDQLPTVEKLSSLRSELSWTHYK